MVDFSVFENGYFLKEAGDKHLTNLGAFSLRNSLASYAKTADDLENLYNNMSVNPDLSKTEVDIYPGMNYAVDACNAILQFQHFLELFLKDILMEVNLLMVYNPSNKPKILLKMADKEDISDTELEGLKVIEFSEANKRVKALLEEGKFPECYNFLTKYLPVFDRINCLRNRIAHRGVFIPRHDALDEIFGKHILPFIKDLTVNVPKYRNSLSWGMNITDEAIQPFQFIIDEYSKPGPNEYVVFTYKLMAHAGFQNRLDYGIATVLNDYNDEKIQKAELLAKIIAAHDRLDIKICPVCGCRTFVEYTEQYEEENDRGEVISAYTYVYHMECHQCGFRLSHWLLNKLHHLTLPIPDYLWVKLHPLHQTHHQKPTKK